ncbi:MAG: crosslink repair DNA glycosylase YcaQ family protein [Thermoleophilaceae bacterium]
MLALCLAGQHLAAPVADPTHALEGWAVQDSPPGAAAAAVLARVESLAPGWVDAGVYEERSLVALYNPRTAVAVVPASEAAAYATSMLPVDDAGLRTIVGPALPDRSADFAEPVELAVEAVADALDGAVLSRDDLHEALRRRLPEELLPWCRGCESHHARRGLLVMASLHGRLCIAGRVGRQPAFARTDQLIGWRPPTRASAGAELVRRYLSGYGPSTPAHLAEWAGLARVHADALWALVEDELAEVRIGGGRARTWLLDHDLSLLEDPPPSRGVRLLSPGDPLLLGRDRRNGRRDDDDSGDDPPVAPGTPAELWPAWSAPPTSPTSASASRSAAGMHARRRGRHDPGLEPQAACAAQRLRSRPSRGQRLSDLRACVAAAASARVTAARLGL